jgi:hypothetical protein
MPTPRQAKPWTERHARYMVMRLLRVCDGAGGANTGKTSPIRIAGMNGACRATDRKGVNNASAVDENCVARASRDGSTCDNVELSVPPSSLFRVGELDDRITACALGSAKDHDTQRGHHNRSGAGIVMSASEVDGVENTDTISGCQECDLVDNHDAAAPTSSECIKIIIEASHRRDSEDDHALESVTGGISKDKESPQLEVTEPEALGVFPTPEAASARVEDASAGSRRCSRRLLRRLSDAGLEVSTTQAVDAARPFPVAILRRDASSFRLVDPAGAGNFDIALDSLEDGALEGTVGEGAAAYTVAETAALLAVYLRRVQPCKESLDRRAQSVEEALLRSDLGSALFTRHGPA